MEKIKIDEKNTLLTLDSAEWENCFPSGEFDISSAKSRIALREMIGDDEAAKRVEVSVFGRRGAPKSVFIKYI